MKIPFSEIKTLFCKEKISFPKVLPLDEIGLPVENITSTFNEDIYEIEVPSNRPDLLSIYEVAKQLGIYWNIEINVPAHLREPQILSFDTTSDIVQVVDPEFAPLYYGVIFTTHIKESPEDFKKRIQLMGFKPINNIVDLTNFICAYYGQPLHAFDYSKIKNGQIIVRKSYEGEKFSGLDGKERVLKSGIGVIADSEKILALAGVIGSSNSQTTEQTKTILLECANFKQQDVYYATRITGIETESSYRFKRGVPFPFALRAISAFFSILKNEMALPVKIEKAVCFNRITYIPVKISITYEFINNRIGMKIEPSAVDSILTRLGCKIEKIADKLVVEIPPHRKDLQIKEDIIEEIARFVGYKNIDGPVTLKMSDFQTNIYEQKIYEIKKYLANIGFFECISTSFVERRLIEKLKLDKNLFIPVNAIKNPDKFLRTKILFTLMDVYRQNLSYGFENINLFEIGKVFTKLNNTFVETENLCLISNSKDAYQLKEIVDNIFYITKNNYLINDGKEEFLQNPFAICWGEEGKTFQLLGYGGEIKKSFLHEFGIKYSDVYYVEFNIEKIAGKKDEPIFYTPVPPFAPLKIDISFIINKNVPYRKIKEFIKNLNIPFLVHLELIDVYKNPQIGEDKKSYTIRLHFQNFSQTLQKKEVQPSVDTIVNLLQKEFGIIKR